MFLSDSTMEMASLSKQAEISRMLHVSCSALPGSFHMAILFYFAILGAKSKAFVYAGPPCVSYVCVYNVSTANFGGIEKCN